MSRDPDIGDTLASNTKEIISKYEKAVVQLATPYSTGTGIYLSSYQLIITNEHVVRDNRQVIVKAWNTKNQLGEVCFIDSRRDLAFLKIYDSENLSHVHLKALVPIHVGETVTAGFVIVTLILLETLKQPFWSVFFTLKLLAPVV